LIRNSGNSKSGTTEPTLASPWEVGTAGALARAAARRIGEGKSGMAHLLCQKTHAGTASATARGAGIDRVRRSRSAFRERRAVDVLSVNARTSEWSSAQRRNYLVREL
jgi:hypothetical protein